MNKTRECPNPPSRSMDNRNPDGLRLSIGYSDLLIPRLLKQHPFCPLCVAFPSNRHSRERGNPEGGT